MPAEPTITTALTMEAAATYCDLSKYPLSIRRHLINAAAQLNPSNPLDTLQTQHSAVVALTVIKVANNIK